MLLLALSLIKVNTAGPELPTNSDKIFHAVAHFVFTVLWYLAFVSKKVENKSAIIYAFISSTIFGIAVEILQGTLTQNRESDVKDIIANIIGAIIASILIISIKKDSLKNNNTLLF